MSMQLSPLARAIAGVGLCWAGLAQAQLANDLTIGNPKAMAMANAMFLPKPRLPPVIRATLLFVLINCAFLCYRTKSFVLCLFVQAKLLAKCTADCNRIRESCS